MADTIYLNKGVDIAKLYKDLDEDKIEKIEKASKDGFTVKELKSLEEDGIDVSILKDNCSDEKDVKNTKNNNDTEIFETEEIKAKKNELYETNKNIRDNNRQMHTLESEIICLQTEVEEEIDEAIEQSKKIAKEQKEDAKNVVKKQLQAYTDSNGEMTYDEFKKNVSGDLDKIAGNADSELSKVVIAIIDAQRKMGILSSYIEEMGSLAKENADLSSQAVEVEKELDDLIKEQEANASSGDSDANCTDPIGFSDEAVRYDFFVDSDNNDDITNENEFLGAKDGFSEMRKLDTNNDGKVDVSELEKGNVKIIQTNKDGTQSIKDAKDIFKEGDSINLGSYTSMNEDIGNGNTLLGTFEASVGGKTLDGYQTLDTEDWLDDNYQFTDEMEGVGRFAQDITTAVEAENFDDSIKELTQKNEELQEKLDEATSQIGLDEATVKNILTLSASEASKKGKNVQNIFETIARKEAELEEKAEEIEEEKDKEEELEETDTQNE